MSSCGWDDWQTWVIVAVATLAYRGLSWLVRGSLHRAKERKL